MIKSVYISIRIFLEVNNEKKNASEKSTSQLNVAKWPPSSTTPRTLALPISLKIGNHDPETP